MPTSDEITLITVVAKVKEIGSRDYDNKIYDNILTIFNKLTTKEKRILLRGLINVCFIVEDKALVSTNDLAEMKDVIVEARGKIESAQSVEEQNRLELAKQLVKLKTTIVQALILLLMTIILGFILISMYSDPSNSFISMLTDLIGILKTFTN